MPQSIFKPVKQEKLSVKIANQIKELILEGKIKPGQVMPPERKLMELLNVSRPSLREALKSLVGMGFLEITQNNRTIVKHLAASRFIDPFDHLLKEDVRTVFELVEVRKAIESWNAYYAAKRATDEDIAALNSNLELIRSHLEDNEDILGDMDAEFHMAIARATQNKIQMHMMFSISDVLRQYICTHYEKLVKATIYDQHAEVVKAIQARDQEQARMAMLEHIDYVDRKVRESLIEKVDQGGLRQHLDMPLPN
jgi:GntR family transcriptional repressor for pyruvate dehydrogenase complex